MSQRCIDCTFLQPGVSLRSFVHHGGQICARRFPPWHKSSHPGDADNFPIVNEADWCGEFKSASDQMAGRDLAAPRGAQVEMSGL